MREYKMTDEGALELMYEMILQAVEDVDLTPKYKTPGKNEDAIYNQRSAVHFLRSEFFQSLCLTLGLADDQIRRKAFSTKTKQLKRQLPT